MTFDPIDGDKVYEPNFAVASVFSIWATKDIMGKSGKDLVGAACSIYGSRTTIILYNT